MAMFDISDMRELAFKGAIVLGGLIVLYGVLWLLATLNIIPVIIVAIFPQIVLIVIGLFIIYTAYNRKNRYY